MIALLGFLVIGYFTNLLLFLLGPHGLHIGLPVLVRGDNGQQDLSDVDARHGSVRLPESTAHPCLEPIDNSLTFRVFELTIPQLAELVRRRLPYSIMNISTNTKPKSERLKRECKGLMRNGFLQKPQKIRLIAMSL